MKRLIIYCEGPTEEQFVTTVLAPYFWKMDVSTVPIGAGGVNRYSRIRKDLIRLCMGDPTATITTMLDYYGLPSDTKGVATASGTPFEKAQHIEMSVERDLGGLNNLFFNLVVHEYEGLLFSQTTAFDGFVNDKQLAELQSICDGFETPEHINDSYETTPSRRIMRIIPGYSKVNDGTKVALSIGIEGISAKCKHFRRWLTKLTTWANENSQ